MPIFEYACQCGHMQEKLQLNGGDAPEHCGEVMTKLISSPGRIIFKGEGFYATEYGNQGYGLNKKERKTRANRELKQRGISRI